MVCAANPFALGCAFVRELDLRTRFYVLIYKRKFLPPQTIPMAHPATTNTLRQAPRLWVCGLLNHCGSFKLLNRQLCQRPVNGHNFQLGVWPPPGELDWAPRVFERILKQGTNPDTRTFREPHDDAAGEHFNLFTRVAAHIPTSPDWLFKALAPYYEKQLPEVDYANLLIDRCLHRFHLRRLGADAAAFAQRYQPERLDKVGRSVLAALSRKPDPIHLVLLLALCHERQWHQPDSAEAREIGDAFRLASMRFLARPEFQAPEVVHLSGRMLRFFTEPFARIRQQAHRSPRPLDPKWPSMNVPNLIIGNQFQGADDLDLTVGLETVTPSEVFSDNPIRKSPNQEQLKGLDRFFAEAATTTETWARYDSEKPEAHQWARRCYLRTRQRLTAPLSVKDVEYRTLGSGYAQVANPTART